MEMCWTESYTSRELFSRSVTVSGRSISLRNIPSLIHNGLKLIGIWLYTDKSPSTPRELDSSLRFTLSTGPWVVCIGEGCPKRGTEDHHRERTQEVLASTSQVTMVTSVPYGKPQRWLRSYSPKSSATTVILAFYESYHEKRKARDSIKNFIFL